MRRIAVLSDTHGLLRPEVVRCLKTADTILHAGDFHTPAILDALQSFGKDLYAVRGNNDWSWGASLPRTRILTIDGLTLFLVHNIRDVPSALSGVDVVVYGHSHQYAQEERSGILWLNPGSCGPQRFRKEVTMAMMTLADGRPAVEKVLLSPARL